MTRPIRHAAGFTLMEMMVVLMLIALTVGLMFDALGVFRLANDRIAARSAEQRSHSLVRDWFADSVAALRAEPDAPFTGNRRALSGLSLQGLRGGVGAPAQIEWTLEEDDGGLRRLVYRQDDGEPLPLAAPPELIGFAYLDDSGKRHDFWPPKLGLHPPLPAAVALVFGRGDGDGDEDGEWLRPVAVAEPRAVIVEAYELEQD